MATQSNIYTGTALDSRTFPASQHIATKAHMAVWRKSVSDGTWDQMGISEFELINNSAILNTEISTVLYDSIEVRVADNPDELLNSPIDIAIVAGEIDNVIIVADNIDSVTTAADNNANIIIVAANDGNITIAADNIASIITTAVNDTNITIVATNDANITTVATIDSDVTTVAGINGDVTTVSGINASVTTVAGIESQIIDIGQDPLRQAILDASANATIATNKADEASGYSDQAELYKWEAEAWEMTAQSYAVEPQGIEVKLYTSDGDGTFTPTDTGDYSALHYKLAAEAYAASINPVDLVHISGTETITGTKTFDVAPLQPNGNSIADADYASSTVGGTVKARLDGTDLYLTINGDDA